MKTLSNWLMSDHRRLPLEMLGLALFSRLIMVIAGWYVSWAIRPVWPPELVGPKSIAPWMQWDGWHYARIAYHGYGNTDDPGVSAFFPLYPLIVRAFSQLVGRTSLPEIQVMAVLVGWAIFLVSIYWCTKMFQSFLSEETARTAMLIFLFSPFAFFLSTAYTESLFMLEVAIVFVSLRKGNFWVASLAAGFATATRVTGLALVLPIVIVAWKNRESLLRIASYALISASGIVMFMVHTTIVRNDPIAFLNAQEGWGGYRERSWNYIVPMVKTPVEWLLADVGNPVMFLNMALYGLSALFLLLGLRVVPIEVTVFSLAVLAQTFLSVQSMGRYLIPVITTYAVAALVIHRFPRWRESRTLVVTGSCIAMTTLFILFGHGAWIV